MLLSIQKLQKNTCKSVNTKTFTNNLNEIYQTWWTILPARVINYLTKTPTSGMRDLLSSCCQGCPRVPQNFIIYRYFPWSLLLKKPFTSDTGTRGPWTGTDSKASSLRTISLWYQVSGLLPKEGSNQLFYPEMISIYHDHYHTIITLWL